MSPIIVGDVGKLGIGTSGRYTVLILLLRLALLFPKPDTTLKISTV